MAVTTLYLVRHAEAVADGHTDDPGLSERGRRQAAAVAARLEALPFAHVLHSPKRRARETAEIIAERLPAATATRSDHVEDRTPIPRDWSAVPTCYHTFLRNVPIDERDPGSTHLDAAVKEFGRLGDTDRLVLAVTHNFVIGWFVRHSLDAPAWRWIGLDQAYGGLTIIRWETDRPARLVAFNDVGHLLLDSGR